MIPHETGSSRNCETRRQFIKKTGTVAVAAAGAGLFNLPVLAGEIIDPSPSCWMRRMRWRRPRRSDGRRTIARSAGRPKRNRAILRKSGSGPADAGLWPATSRASNLARQLLQAGGVSLAEAPESFVLARGKIGNKTFRWPPVRTRARLVYALLNSPTREIFRRPAGHTEN